MSKPDSADNFSPARKFRDTVTGKTVLGIFLRDCQQFVTMPASKFWTTGKEEVSGCWNKTAFITRFEEVDL